MFLLIFIGTALLLLGMRQLWTLVLFYLGRRRDLYFHPERLWLGMGRMGGALALLGAGLLSAALLHKQVTLSTIALISLGLIFGEWLGVPLGLIVFPPPWLAALEHGRSREDLLAIQRNGAALLESHPRIFKQIIADPTGWDQWLLTVLNPVPVALLDMYADRAKLALRYRLYPLAVHAADQIIYYRPDQPLGYYLRAQAHYYDRKYWQAVADLNHCITMQPHAADLYYQRARVYLMLNEYGASSADVEQALLLLPDSTIYRTLQHTLAQYAESQ